MRSRPRLTIAVAAALSAALALSPSIVRAAGEPEAVAQAHPSQAAHAVPANTIHMTVREWRFGRALERLHPGPATIVIHNTGRIAHVVGLLRTGYRAGALPLRRGAPVRSGLVRQVRIAPGAVARMSVTVREGHYVLTCLLRGHYRHQMRKDVSVSRSGAAAPIAAGPVESTVELVANGPMSFNKKTLNAVEGKVTTAPCPATSRPG